MTSINTHTRVHTRVHTQTHKHVHLSPTQILNQPLTDDERSRLVKSAESLYKVQSGLEF